MRDLVVVSQCQISRLRFYHHGDLLADLPRSVQILLENGRSITIGSRGERHAVVANVRGICCFPVVASAISSRETVEELGLACCRMSSNSRDLVVHFQVIAVFPPKICRQSSRLNFGLLL